MKYWWRNVVKDYLTFSAKEKNGLLIMGLVIAAIILFSTFYKKPNQVITKDAFQHELAQLKITVDSPGSGKTFDRDEDYIDYSRPKANETERYFKGELFAFDPNTIDAAGWKRLGIRDKTIATIQKFLASGYRFKRPEDIKKVYGLSRESAERLIPYIHIHENETTAKNTSNRPENVSVPIDVNREVRNTKVIDINTADTTAFISLPGIGSKLATRIVNFRQKLGGFHSVAQLGETYGIPDSTFQKIKPRLACTNPALKTIDINTADVNQLRSHPYLKWNIANAIVAFRQQHGNYTSVEDIKKIDIITEELFAKIAPYLVVNK